MVNKTRTRWVARFTLLSFYVGFFGPTIPFTRFDGSKVAEARIDPLRPISRQVRKGNMLVVLDTSGSMTGAPGESFAAGVGAQSWELGVDCDLGEDCLPLSAVGACQSSGRLCVNDAQCQLGYCQYGNDPCLQDTDCPAAAGKCQVGGLACLYNSDCAPQPGNCSIWGTCSSVTPCPSIGFCNDNNTTICQGVGTACSIRHCANDLTKTCQQSSDCAPSTTTPPTTQVTTGMVGHWNFDEASNAPIAADTAGTPDNAVLMNDNAASDFVSGQSGNAFRFDNTGTSPYFRVPSSPEINTITNAVSISTWYYRPSGLADSRQDTLLVRKNATGQGMYGIVAHWNGQFCWGAQCGTDCTAASAIPMDTWVHLTGTYDQAATTVKLYINGSPVFTDAAYVNNGCSTTPPISNATTDITIGDQPGVTNWSTNAKVDDMRLYNRVLTDAEAATIAGTGAPPPPPPPPTNGLVGYWKFNEQSLATVAADSGGNGDDGVLGQANAGSDFVAGKVGNAFNFVPSGTGPYFSVASSTETNSITAGVSIAGWYMYTGGAGPGTLLARRKTAGGQMYSLKTGAAASSPVFNIGNTDVVATYTFGPNVWTHVAATYDAATGAVKMYFNGISAAVAPTTVATGWLVTDTTSVKIGAEYDGALYSKYLTGKLDEMTLYNRVLTPGEIAAAAAIAPPAGLLGYYKFDESSGAAVAVDSSGAGNDLTRGNCAASTFGAGYKGNGYVMLGDGTAFHTPANMLDGRSQYSFAFWVKPDGTHSPGAQWDSFLSNQDPANLYSHPLDLGVTSTGQCPEFGASASCSGTTDNRLWNLWDPNAWDPAGLPVGQWTHVALTIDAVAGQRNIYKNGVLVNTNGSVPGRTDGYPVFIGATKNQNINWNDCGYIYSGAHGTMDELKVFGKALTPTEVAQISAEAPPAATGNLIAYYQFENTTNPSLNGEITVDSSGNNNHGTLYWDAGLNTQFGINAWEPGKSGNGFRSTSWFSGAWIDVPASPSLDAIVSQFTFAAWYKGETTDWNTMLSRGPSGASGNSVDFKFMGNHMQLVTSYGCCTDTCQTIATFPSPLTTWTHFAATLDEGANTIKLYVDGVLDNTCAWPDPRHIDPGATWGIGKKFNGGVMDEVQIYQNVLSPTEITAVAAATNPNAYACLTPTCAAPGTPNTCSASPNTCQIQAGGANNTCLGVNATDVCVVQQSTPGQAKICRFAMTACAVDANCQAPYLPNALPGDECVPATSRAVVAKRVLKNTMLKNAAIMNFGLMTFSQGQRGDANLDGVRDNYYFPYYASSSISTVTESRFFDEDELNRYGCFDWYDPNSGHTSNTYSGSNVGPLSTCVIKGVSWTLEASQNSRYQTYRGSGNYAPVDMNWCGDVSCPIATVGGGFFFKYDPYDGSDPTGTADYVGSYYFTTTTIGTATNPNTPKYFPTYQGRSFNVGAIKYSYFYPRQDYYSNPMSGTNRPPIMGPDCDPTNTALLFPSDSDNAKCSMTCGANWDPGLGTPLMDITDVTATNQANVDKFLPLLEKAKDGGLMMFGGTPSGCALFNNFGIEATTAGLSVPAAVDKKKYSAYDYMVDVKARDVTNNAPRASCRDNFILLMTDGAATGPGDGQADPNDKLALYSTCADPKCGANDPRAAGCACKSVLNAQKLREELGVRTYVLGFSPDATRGVPGTVNDNIARAGGTCREGTLDPVAFPPRVNEPRRPKATPSKCAYRADNESELNRELQRVIYQSTAGSYSTTPASSTGGLQQAGSVVPSTIAVDARADFPDWRGHLIAYDTASATPTTPLWDAGMVGSQTCPDPNLCPPTGRFPDPDDAANYKNWAMWKYRNVYTSNGTTLFKIDVDPVTEAVTNKTTLGALTSYGAQVFANDDEAERVAKWLLGDPKQGNRSVLGSFVNSTPISVGSPGSSPMPGGKEYFDQFKNRPELIYVGSDDGMLHAFFARDTTIGAKTYPGGAEAFAYIPPDMLKVMVTLYSQGGQFAPPEDHIFGMASSPKVKSLCVTGCTLAASASWKTVLAMGEGWGGSDAFALDITNVFSMDTSSPPQPVGMNSPPAQVLWHSENTVSAGVHDVYEDFMGRATSVPAFYFGKGAGLNDHRLIMASGYQNDTTKIFQGSTLMNVDALTGNVIDTKPMLLAPPPVNCVPATTYGNLTTFTDVAVARDNNGREKQEILSAYFGDTWGNLWRYVPNRNVTNDIGLTGSTSLVAGYGCQKPLHFSPTVVQLDRDDPINHPREIYLVQVTNGANDPATDAFLPSMVTIRKETVATSGNTVTGVNSGLFPGGVTEVQLVAGTNNLCFAFDVTGACLSTGKIPVDARPTSTPLAILKSDGTGFDFLALWYQPPQTGCDKGITFLTVHQVNVSQPGITKQVTGMQLAAEPVTSTVITGTKAVFIDSQGVHDITSTLGMQFVVGGSIGYLTKNGGQRFQLTGWNELP